MEDKRVEGVIKGFRRKKVVGSMFRRMKEIVKGRREDRRRVQEGKKRREVKTARWCLEALQENRIKKK